MKVHQAQDEGEFFTVEQVARRLKVSTRWLAAQCRAEKVEHVHIARQRRFTRDQVDALIASKTVRPAADLELDKTRERVMRQLGRR
jgi:excisionase family DNA binding protein